MALCDPDKQNSGAFQRRCDVRSERMSPKGMAAKCMTSKGVAAKCVASTQGMTAIRCLHDFLLAVAQCPFIDW